jgi:glutathione S-transferase
MTLEVYEVKHGGESAWERAISGLQQLAAILKEDRSGPFCLGGTLSYADFLIVGLLERCRCLQDGIYERIVGIDSAFQDVYDACNRGWSGIITRMDIEREEETSWKVL